VPEIPTGSEPNLMKEIKGLPSLFAPKPIKSREVQVELKSRVQIPEMPQPKDKRRSYKIRGHYGIVGLKQRSQLPKLDYSTLKPKN
jgi:hypothetical protein